MRIFRIISGRWSPTANAHACADVRRHQILHRAPQNALAAQIHRHPAPSLMQRW
jgi:hypothetical protein